MNARPIARRPSALTPEGHYEFIYGWVALTFAERHPVSD